MFRPAACALSVGVALVATTTCGPGDGRNATTAAPPVVAQPASVGAAASPPTIDVTYIANEGVLVAAGDTRVVIDGLFRPYESYVVLPEADRDRVETGQAPFEGIDLILVSHLHGDHFHAESVARHLRHNPQATLVSSKQVTGDVLKLVSGDDAIRQRVRAATPAAGERVALTVGAIDVQVLGLRHGSARFSWIQNLGHLITIGGKKVLHIGDADTDMTAFRSLGLEREGIDVAFLPGWFLTERDGQTIIRDHIRPRQLVAVHLPPSGFERMVGSAKRAFPDSDAFTALLEKRRY